MQNIHHILTTEEVQHIAKLAKLSLTEKEIAKFAKQLGDTIHYVENLNKLDTKDLSPTNQVGGARNVLREDVIFPSLSQEEALSNTKSVYQGFFKVKAVLEEK